MIVRGVRVLLGEGRLSRADRVVLETLLPACADGPLPPLLDAGFEAFWTDVERTALPAWSLGFRLALFAATWLAPVLLRRIPPLTRYDRPTRERMLAALEGSRVYLLRQMLWLLKTDVALCYGADPAVQAAIGYPLARPEAAP